MSRAGSKVTLADLAELQRSGLVKVTGRGKYGSKRCVVDGEHFDSKLEARRWMVLRDMERRREISGLIRQPRFPLDVGGVHIADYFADFQYYDSHGVRVVEDVKAASGVTVTQVYKLKKKLVWALYRIRVEEFFG